jgi:hypothetical protein
VRRNCVRPANVFDHLRAYEQSSPRHAAIALRSGVYGDGAGDDCDLRGSHPFRKLQDLIDNLSIGMDPQSAQRIGEAYTRR